LAIGYRRNHPASGVSRSGAGVDSRTTTFLDVIRKAEGTHHIAIGLALLVYVADISLTGGTRVTELETDTVPFQDIALAVSESVINEATCRGAEGVLLMLANHKGRLTIE
jgi:hypothetical protein